MRITKQTLGANIKAKENYSVNAIICQLV